MKENISIIYYGIIAIDTHCRYSGVLMAILGCLHGVPMPSKLPRISAQDRADAPLEGEVIVRESGDIVSHDPRIQKAGAEHGRHLRDYL
jgi:hypothetical protein